jgi:hypothetical protein
LLSSISGSVISHMVPFVTVSCTSRPSRSGKGFLPVIRKLRTYPSANISAFSDLGDSLINCSGACHYEYVWLCWYKSEVPMLIW